MHKKQDSSDSRFTSESQKALNLEYQSTIVKKVDLKYLLLPTAQNDSNSFS